MIDFWGWGILYDWYDKFVQIWWTEKVFNLEFCIDEISIQQMSDNFYFKPILKK